MQASHGRGFEIARGWEERGIDLPKRQTRHAAGYDLAAAQDVTLPPISRHRAPVIVPTGLKAYCQPDECYLLFNRSSNPGKGYVLANGVGVIDSDYYGNSTNDGQINVLLLNLTEQEIQIKKGDRIAQLVFQKFLIADNDMATGERRGGIGSTDYEVSPIAEHSLAGSMTTEQESTNTIASGQESAVGEMSGLQVQLMAPEIIFDVDDVLWPLVDRVFAKLNIPLEKETDFNFQANPVFTDQEKANIMDGFCNPETFNQMNFYPGLQELLRPEELGAKVFINSNSYNEAIAERKRQQLLHQLPNFPESRLTLNVISGHANKKRIRPHAFIFVDDSPYNIALSDALINILPIKPWNDTDAARQQMSESGGMIVEPVLEKLQEIVQKPNQKYIIYGKNLAEINQIIYQIIKLNKEQHD